MTLDLQAYLSRIGLSMPPSPDLEGLRKLHRQHLFSVPFENLDIGMNRQIILDLALLEKKIVHDNRGGFCYELNALFCQLLKQLGFEVVMIAAGVCDTSGTYGPEFDHMALLVTLDSGQWLADVGFGRNFLEPLEFKLDIEQADPAGRFKIQSMGKSQFVFSMQNETGSFIPQFRFTTRARKLIDFAEMCDFHQTSNDSHFTQGNVCTLATAKGRITLTKNRLIKSINGEDISELLSSQQEVSQALLTYFNIVLKIS